MSESVRTNYRVDVWMTVDGLSYWRTIGEFFGLYAARDFRADFMVRFPYALSRITKEETVMVSTTTVEEVW